MPSDAVYRNRKKSLNKYRDFSFTLGKKLTPSQKGAITKAWKKHENQINLERASNREGSGYKFVKANKSQLRKLRKMFPDRVTNKGVFIKFPANKKGKAEKVRINKDGSAEVQIGKRTQVYVKADAELYVKDKDAFISDVLKDRPEPDAIALEINGNTGNEALSPKKFVRKIEDNYLSKVNVTFQKAKKGHHKSAARITGVVLTYFGPMKGRRKMTTKRLRQLTED